MDHPAMNNQGETDNEKGPTEAKGDRKRAKKVRTHGSSKQKEKSTNYTNHPRQLKI